MGSRTSGTGLQQEIGRAVIRSAAVDGLLVCRRDGTIEVCNPAAARFLGSRRTRVIGRTLHDVFKRFDSATELRFQSALLAGGDLEFVVPRPVGEDCWTEVRVLPIRGGAAFALRDVTDRERSERGLRRKERRLLAANDSLRLAHKAARAASWEWRAGRGLGWLDLGAARQLIGLPPTWTEADLIADWRDLVVDADRHAVDTGLEKMRRQGEASYEFRVLGADGRQHWLQASGAVVERDTLGNPARISGVTLDVTEAKAAEQALKREIAHRARVEQHQILLLHELNHRVKNILTTVQSIARQTFARRGVNDRIVEFEERLLALAWTHDVLTGEDWISASLGEILKRTLSPHRDPEGRRIQLQGPEVQVSPRLAVAVAMAVHELATNAVKYGALSNDTGVVTVTWRVETRDGRDRLLLDWRERGGPPVVKPRARGFGSRLIEHGLGRDIDGRASLAFEPGGVRCHLDAALERGVREPIDLPQSRTGDNGQRPSPRAS